MTLEAKENLRIISLLPSATEILCRLGLEDTLVGVSHECDYPESVKKLPKLTQPRLNPNQRGSEIHRDLKTLLQQGLSIYDIDVEKISELGPDLILTQDQCHVCAVSLVELEKAISHLSHKKTQVCSLSPHTLDDIHRDFTKVGRITNREEAAKDLITEFWIELNTVNSKVGTDIPSHPKVLCLEWLEPLMVAGGWIPEIVKMAGGVPQIISKPEKFKEVSWGEIEACDPDVVTVFPCGYSIDKTVKEIKSSPILKQLSTLRAFKDKKIFICDGNHWFNRPGPRITQSCQLLGALFHPQKFESVLEKNNKTMFVNFQEVAFL